MKLRALHLACLAALAAGVGCHQDMWLQPKSLGQSKSAMFADGGGSRLPVPGTVEFGKPRTDEAFYTGRVGGKLVAEFPIPVTEALLRRGKERYEIFCLNCHGAAGHGDGMIAQRGFALARPVGNYHTERMRSMPVGHYFEVMTKGFGTMFPLEGRLNHADRWAVAAYVKVLQESQNVPVSSLPPEIRAKLEAMPRTPDQDAPPEPPSMASGPVEVPRMPVPAPGDGGPAAPDSVQPPDEASTIRPGTGGAR
jgi:mono/diheme cytochrome c family protein